MNFISKDLPLQAFAATIETHLIKNPGFFDMPTAFTHAVVGASLATAVSNKKVSLKLLLLSVLCAVIPDFDVITFKFGIPYGSFFGHRGFFHSIFFSVLFGFAVSTIFYPRRRSTLKEWLNKSIYFSIVTSSHGLLDAFTNGGLGIALLSPLTTERFFFWATPILVSPINLKVFFSGRVFGILKNEFLWVWLPALCIGIMGFIYNSFVNKHYRVAPYGPEPRVNGQYGINKKNIKSKQDHS